MNYAETPVRRRRVNHILVIAAAWCAACLAQGAPDKAEWDAQPRVVAIGDVHGDYAGFVKLLTDAGLVDEDQRWTGGKTHLVQLGDVPDRGPDTLKVIRLLQDLGAQARRVEGAVHCLIGNHEAMNMEGDLRYVHPGEHAAFVTRESSTVQLAHYERAVASIKAERPKGAWPLFDEAFKSAWLEKHPPGFVEHAQAWSPDGDVGRWILDHNAVLRIGDTLFVHGGIGPKYATWPIARINNAVRAALRTPEKTQGTIVADQEGPLWYRGLASNPELSEHLHLKKILTGFGVKRIVVGHTPMPGVIVPRFHAQVILADAGMNPIYGGGRACVLIENNVAYALHHGTKLELPTGGVDTVISYLRQAAALDPGSTPTLRLIRKMEAALTQETGAASQPESEPVDAPAP